MLNTTQNTITTTNNAITTIQNTLATTQHHLHFWIALSCRTESVAEKMLTNWFTFLLHRFLKVCDLFSTINFQSILIMCYAKSYMKLSNSLKLLSG